MYILVTKLACLLCLNNYVPQTIPTLRPTIKYSNNSSTYYNYIDYLFNTTAAYP